MSEIVIDTKKIFDKAIIQLDKNDIKPCIEIYSSIVDKLKKEQDNYLMQFLKSKGYRPKPTIKYVKSLQQRLKRKKLQLRYYQSIEYGKPEETKNGTICKGLVKQLYFIDSIDNPVVNQIDMQKMLDNWERNMK